MRWGGGGSPALPAPHGRHGDGNGIATTIASSLALFVPAAAAATPPPQEKERERERERERSGFVWRERNFEFVFCGWPVRGRPAGGRREVLKG
jgi:hypothetical protein